MPTYKNQLFYGDNLDVLRQYVKTESVDLVYLDPPFNSRQDYNILFAEKDGSRSSSQIHAFEDTWEWNIEAECSYEQIVDGGGRVADAMRAFRTFLGASDMMAYLSMMAPRLIELHRVLKETGSIYLHCDPTASHYLKILMDGIFGPQWFKNEIVWKRSHAHSDAKQGAHHFGRITDTLLFYSKGAKTIWNMVYKPYDDRYIERDYRRIDADGRRYRIDNLQGPGGAAKGNPCYEVMGVTRYWRYSKDRMQKLIEAGRVIQTRPGAVPQFKRYLDEMPGVPIQNLWDDLPPLNNRSKEVLGYGTQKPEALLERIIRSSSSEGDLVLDPFCGCGTTVQVAERLSRRWIGVDITHLAIGLIKGRLIREFGDNVADTYEIVGEPRDFAGAAALAAQDKYQFQWWALAQVGARPTEMKKGADRGIDGRLYFHDDRSARSKQIIFSVKAGGVTVSQVRDLRGVLAREKAEIGVFITFERPTKPMLREAAEAGSYRSGPLDKTSFARIQVLNIEDLLKGKQPEYPKYGIDVTINKSLKLSRLADAHREVETRPARKPVASVRPASSRIRKAV